MDKIPVMAVVIPCYNEEDTVFIIYKLIYKELSKLILMNKIHKNSFILFVDDGSSDKTAMIIKKLSLENETVKGIYLKKNAGHQNALYLGMKEVYGECDACITIDCDGQDDQTKIPDMVEKFLSGCDVVYGVRESRSEDSFLKRITANIYYHFLHTIEKKTINNHADFRLCSKAVLSELFKIKTNDLYLRGMIPKLGFKGAIVYYNRKKRIAGKSHYSIKKMFNLAISGIKIKRQ